MKDIAVFCDRSYEENFQQLGDPLKSRVDSLEKRSTQLGGKCGLLSVAKSVGQYTTARATNE